MSTAADSPRFLPWAIAFVITRAGDLWSTGLFMLQPGGASGEMNPLTSVFGLGYWPLIGINAALSLVLLYGHWYYCVHFGIRALNQHPTSLSEYISLVFFHRVGQAWRALFSVERNQRLHNSQMAHVLLKTITCVSVMAVLHNLGQVYDWSLNDHLRTLLVRPSIVYYSLCIPLVIAFAHRMFSREYTAWLRYGRTAPTS
jgi:hypothetical protein